MRFDNGKIFKIQSNKTDKFYIGSTCQKLTQRLSGLRRDFKSDKLKNEALRSILKYEDCHIVLLEAFPCKNIEELRAKEEEHRNKFKQYLV